MDHNFLRPNKCYGIREQMTYVAAHKFHSGPSSDHKLFYIHYGTPCSLFKTLSAFITKLAASHSEWDFLCKIIKTHLTDIFSTRSVASLVQ